jgi:hypothetical protein
MRLPWEWMYFPGDWLEKNILRKRGMIYWIDRLVMMRPLFWLGLWSDWVKVKSLLPETRRCLAQQSGNSPPAQ